jgi:DNA-binding HxlR family transcriptional regulator
MVSEEQVLAFVRSSIPSAWALELLLLLRRERVRAWRADALVAELRGSEELVAQSLAMLTEAGLVAVSETGEYAYRPERAELAELIDALADLHAHKPLTVLSTIFSAPSSRIRSFADAFLFRKK